ncbi:phage tail protein [Pseudoalteromonas xiamenensis]|uniref:Phage tail protein n=1 Tax=Pseudoalteromonas xiamenensis TaxID=882626 RepID=A0A975DFX3_9GAMM|nr:phage tail protein [Pseudoalteromonas xiamenensis]QTH70935.1 phage tail protein [Pseudoalteromonas xiamenensis]
MSHTEYWTTLTANGRQKVLAAIAQQGKIEISHFAVGDGTIGESHTDLTSLKYRNEISSLHVVSGESALVEMFAVVPADVGGFYVREGAFYTSDGEAFAIIKYPETYKPDASDNAAAELGIRAIVDVEQAQVVTEKIDPSMVYASREWVKRTLSNDLALLQDEIEKNAANLTVLDSKLNNKGIATKWQDLTGSVGHAFETEYNGEKYVVKNPMDVVAIAPPPFAGRSYIEQNGTNSYIKLKSPIVLQAGYKVKLKFEAPKERLSEFEFLLDGTELGSSRFFFYFGADGKLRTAVNTKIDGEVATTNISSYPTDGLIHEFEADITSALEIGKIASRYDAGSRYTLRVYDLEVFNSQGERIHYFPLRTDAIDYLAGNLVKDEEFTYAGNWEVIGNPRVENNSVVFDNPAGTNAIRVNQTYIGTATTFRLVCDVARTSGELVFGTVNSTGAVSPLVNINSSGKTDSVFVASLNGLRVGLSETSFDFIGAIKNFRVIPMVELSPSASFSSATGFALSGGVTITGGKAVFGSGTGTKAVRFENAKLIAGKKYRVVVSAQGGTTGSFAASFAGSQDLTLRTANGVYDQVITMNSTPTNANIYTQNGWDGNIEYFSVTEVTDGEVIGESEIVYENHWSKQLDSKDIGTKSDIDAGTSTKIVPHVKAIKEAINEAVLPINEKLSKTTHALSKSIDLSSQVQNSPYRKSVIALCQLNSPYANFNSFSEGVIRGHRSNSLHPDITAHIAVAKRYASDGMRGNVLLKGGLREVKLCTFMYKGNKYGGLHFFYDIAEHQTIAFDGLSNFDIFGLDYINTQTGEKLNAEVADSLRFDGIAVDDELYFNESEVLRKKQLATVEESLAGTSSERVATPKGVKDFLAQFGLGSKSANAVLISSGDLNNYRGQFFGYVSAAVSGRVANVPVPNNGYFVSLPSSASNYNMQLYFISLDTQPMRVYFRRQCGADWKSWQRFYSTEDKPTADEIHATLGGLASSPFTFKGRDLLIYGKRALVGYDPTRENKLIINYGADWPQVDVAGNWQFGQDVSIVGDLKFTGTDSYIWTPNRENGFFGVYDSYKNAVALKYTYDGGFEFKRKLVLGSSGQTVLDAGGGLSVKVTTPTGWVDIGSQNPDFCHFYTSNPAYFFDRKISVRGEIYAGANYDKKVYHEGNKPTASDVGAGTFNGAVYAAKGYSWRCTLQTTPNAIGVDVYKHDGSVRVGGCGVYSGSGGIDDAIAYLGTGKDPWNGIEGIRVNASKFTYKGFDVYHKGNLPPLLSSFGIGAENDLRGTIYELGLPRDIYGTGTRSGLANGGTDGLGIPWVSGSNKLGLLSVSAQWVDGTGVVSFVREFTSYTGGKFYQTGKDANTWNAWRKVIDTSNIQNSLQDTTAKPTSGSLSLGENHLTTNNTIKLPATTSLDVDSVVKVTKRFAVTPQIEVDNPTTDKIAFFKDRVVQFDTSITFDVGAILTFILNDNKEWELQ